MVRRAQAGLRLRCWGFLVEPTFWGGFRWVEPACLVEVVLAGPDLTVVGDCYVFYATLRVIGTL